ncbi:deaminase reductase [Microlunatus endophyticus]|uniref:Deaminase reductase n=1 Tax=Microlunatus endophyticus TaxID=1716077 RepID=A0A917W946_9ACTN|nr:dihydrofolate reductase family protein [Microlunatus endophyticus]GGL79632.1 deaminase reductase [Microlunatus endophyticus]
MSMTVELVVDLFVSVDGWAGGDGLPAYFGYFGSDLQEWVVAEKSIPELVLLGRRTYDTFRTLPAGAWVDDHAHLMGLDKVVFSRKLESVEWPRTQVCRDLIGDVRQLKAEAATRLRTWGSMSVAGQLLAAGLVDRLRLMRFPLLVGPVGRQRAFERVPRIPLELLRTRVLDGRLILDEYRPVVSAAPMA